MRRVNRVVRPRALLIGNTWIDLGRVRLMCGRFYLHSTLDKLLELIEGLVANVELAPRYNIAPSQPLAVIHADAASGRHLHLMRWGLIPGWSKTAETHFSLINARAESILEKPAFRGAIRHRRCLIPADGFYEWCKQPGTRTKQPYAIHAIDRRPLFFGGIWEHWLGADGSELESCAIVTTEANRDLAEIHERMPLILPPDVFDAWLDRTVQNPTRIASLLNPPEAGHLRAYKITTAVNNVRHDDASLLQPLPELF